MPHLLVYAALPTGLTAGSRVEFLTLCMSVGDLKPIIGKAIGVPQPLHVYVDGRELDDRFTGLLDGTTILVSTVTPRHDRLSALGCSVWPEDLQQALDDANAALDAGLPPRLAKEGEGATYFLVARDPARGYVGCFKPQDEEAGAPRNPRRSVGLLGEPSMRSGILSGEGFVREVAAFLLDHEGFAGVPPTALVVGRHPAFNNGRDGVDTAPLVEKIGAFQQFIADGTIVEEFGSCARLPDEEVRWTSSGVSLVASLSSSWPLTTCRFGRLHFLTCVCSTSIVTEKTFSYALLPMLGAGGPRWCPSTTERAYQVISAYLHL